MKDPTNVLLQHVRSLVGAADTDSFSDRELLRRFSRLRDEAAFAALLRRHGPMVWRVCRRVLPQEQDAEDAFQATFLVLARKAASGRWQDSVGGWLHEVAHRLARKSRILTARRAARDYQKDTPPARDPLTEITGRELFELLDAELVRLPERYRTPLVLCCLEGLSRDEAARRLGLPLATLCGRLQRARERLRGRLARRGMTLPAALGVTLLAADEMKAAVSIGLGKATLDAALRWRAGEAVTAVVSVQAAALVKAASGSLGLSKMKKGALLALVLGLATGGAGVAFYSTWAGRPPEAAVAGTSEQEGRGVRRPLVAGDEVARVDWYGDPLPPGALARLGTVRFRHGSYIRSVAFSPDGKTLVTVGELGWDNKLSFWDAATGREHRRLRVPGDHLTFFPNGSRLAALHYPDAVMILNAATGEVQQRFPGPNGPRVHSFAITRDGNTVATGGSKKIGIWDVNTGTEVTRFDVDFDEVRNLAFAPDGQTLAFAGWNNKDRVVEPVLWDLVAGKERLRIHGHTRAVTCLAFSPDGQTLATGNEDRTVHLWDVASGRQRLCFENHRSSLFALTFSPDGTLLASTEAHDSWREGTPTVRLWRTDSGKETVRLDQQDFVFDLAFAPDGRTLAVAGRWSALVRRFDVATGMEIGPQEGHRDEIRSVAWAPDGRTVATGGDRTIRLWDPSTGKERFRSARQESLVYDVVFALDGKQLAAVVGGPRDPIGLFDPVTGRELLRLGGTWQGIGPLAFSPDGKTLAGCPTLDTIALWETRTGRPLRTLKTGPDAQILGRRVSFLPDGRHLATMTCGPLMRTRFRVWNLETGHEVPLFKEQWPGVNKSNRAYSEPVFSPDGRTVATWEPYVSSYRLCLWDNATGMELHAPDEPDRPHGLVFSPDGKFLANCDGGPKNTEVQIPDEVQIRDAATGEVVLRLPGVQRRGVSVLAFSPDGHTLATGSFDSTVLIWDVRALAGREQRAAVHPPSEE
jgi:RNA polymerase sigma factor (sigma-70 family)